MCVCMHDSLCYRLLIAVSCTMHNNALLRAAAAITYMGHRYISPWYVPCAPSESQTLSTCLYEKKVICVPVQIIEIM